LHLPVDLRPSLPSPASFFLCRTSLTPSPLVLTPSHFLPGSDGGTAPASIFSLRVALPLSAIFFRCRSSLTRYPIVLSRSHVPRRRDGGIGPAAIFFRCVGIGPAAIFFSLPFLVNSIPLLP